jgi:hypothetical protein
VKILLDECVPKDLRLHLPGHDCKTVPQAGFEGKANGELLALAEQAGWQVLVTVDQAMAHEQNMAHRNIALVVIFAKSNRLPDLLPHVPNVLAVLNAAKPGQIIRAGEVPESI